MVTSAATRTKSAYPPAPLPALLEGAAAVGSLPGQVSLFEANEEIFGEGEPATEVYRVVSGVVRTFTVLSDGRRQIEAFHFAGDVFGLASLPAHRLSAEAVSAARIMVVRRSQLEALGDRDLATARELWKWTAQALEHTRSQMLLLGRKSAVERVASFLLEMAQMRSDGTLELPMSRTDIADYLGLTIETVSRTLTHLQRSGAISLPTSRRINLRNKPRLCALMA